MPVSRRGFFGLIGGGESTSGLAAMLAARGHEEESAWLHAAEQAQGATGQTTGGRQGGAGRAGGAGGQGGGRGGRAGGAAGEAAPEITVRISSNENPLGPGKVALDAIVAKFPEAGRYPF